MIEVYGAQGGQAKSTWGHLATSSYGGYSNGYLILEKSNKLYVTVGGGVSGINNLSGGYNGGGAGQSYTVSTGTSYGAGGGGATHIATTNRGVLANYNSYRDEVLIVAGGSSGSQSLSNIGFSGNPGGGENKASYKFGQGAAGSTMGSTDNCAHNGGGGGYYGGVVGRYPSLTADTGGGSGYIGGVPTITFNGVDYSPSTVTGGASQLNGYAKITLVSTSSLPTSPVIKGGNDSYSSAPITISIEKEGTSNVGIKYYEYYLGTSSEVPSYNTTATGTTNNKVTVENEGSYYIWYRTVSNNNTKSNWSNYQKVNIDTTKPTVTISVSGKTAFFTLKDNTGIIGYGVNQSSTTEPNYTSITSIISTTQTWTASTSGTYYVWVKDSAGNVSVTKFTTTTELTSLLPNEMILFKDISTRPGKGTVTITGNTISRSGVSGSNCDAYIDSINTYDLTNYSTLQITYNQSKWVGIPDGGVEICIYGNDVFSCTSCHTQAGTYTDTLDISNINGIYNFRIISTFWDFTVTKITLK